MDKIAKRSDKIAFFGIIKDGNVEYKRMRGFTELSINKALISFLEYIKNCQDIGELRNIGVTLNNISLQNSEIFNSLFDLIVYVPSY